MMFFCLGPTTKMSQRLPPRFLRRQPPLDVLLDRHLKMRSHLGIEIRIEKPSDFADFLVSEYFPLISGNHYGCVDSR